MKKVLITGAGGYIGSTLVDMLLEKDYKVIGYDRYFFGQNLLKETLENPNFTLVKKDIRDIQVDDFKDVDMVCDLAALSNDPAGDLDEELTYNINHLGRVGVAIKAKEAGVKRYILASSCSVYGTGENESLSETTIPKPITTYAKANFNAENDILPLGDDSFSVTALRQATVYGLSKRMRFDLVINIMTLNAIQNGKIFILGGGKQWRPLVHTKDTSRAFIATLEADTSKVQQQVFNVGGNDNNFQILNLAYMVRENIPFPLEFEIAPDDADKRDYNVSFNKIKSVLGFEPKYSPEYAIKEIYDALKLGKVDTSIKTNTMSWYKYILDAQKTLQEISLNGRLL